ncbi:sigma-70 family RNA polymerase sigma factor [Lysinibacillus sp. G4S2]|uniref:sigma-70 family RNA polymerase sigma factor n=1 Tax=Lysinibacillus sp. G4S2 TaxID=3055859 RepID=UPI0025A0850B|nr:sigma-70 family RNA polymerase sigma factor [Lysinibacillus sp. G4S2]MDM5247940.1 sigma-70 family RNA polymerase sigma factor [Lysinibacillus sp. G4S2]
MLINDLNIEDLYKEYKNYCLSIAYYLLGSMTDAEDIVQDTFLKIKEHEKIEKDITNLKAYINKMIVNRCMNELKSSRKKKESYIGTWLPEPILQEFNSEPLEKLIQADQLSYSYMVLMENLSPRERIAYVLSNALGLKHSEIADILKTTTVNSRKILSRAQIKMGRKSGKDLAVNLQKNYIEQFILALSNGDIQGVTHLLSNDVLFAADGGGNVRTAINIIEGKERVSALISGISKKFFFGKSATTALINNQYGIVVTEGQKITGVFCFDWNSSTRTIKKIFYVVAPNKLKYNPF